MFFQNLLFFSKCLFLIFLCNFSGISAHIGPDSDMSESNYEPEPPNSPDISPDFKSQFADKNRFLYGKNPNTYYTSYHAKKLEHVKNSESFFKKAWHFSYRSADGQQQKEMAVQKCLDIVEPVLLRVTKKLLDEGDLSNDHEFKKRAAGVKYPIKINKPTFFRNADNSDDNYYFPYWEDPTQRFVYRYRKSASDSDNSDPEESDVPQWFNFFDCYSDAAAFYALNALELQKKIP